MNLPDKYRQQGKKWLSHQRQQMDIIAHVSRYFYGYLILAIALVVLAVAARFDYELTTILAQHPRTEWVAYFRQSVFQKGAWGYTDFGILFYALMIGTYIYCHTGPRPEGATRRHPRLAQASGYLLSSGLLVGIVMVHGIKLALGRARPYQVLDGHFPYTAWYELGPLNSLAGDGSGSFPSGHTATTLWLVALWFLVERYTRARQPATTKSHRAINWLSALWLAFALLQALVTGVTRSITREHWLTDWLGATLMGLALINICYRALVVYAPDPVPRYYEIRWAGWRIAAGVALALILTGMRLAYQAL